VADRAAEKQDKYIENLYKMLTKQTVLKSLPSKQWELSGIVSLARWANRTKAFDIRKSITAVQGLEIYPT